MEYEQSVATAPAGWRHFTIDDIARLPAGVRSRELARVPPGEPDERVLRGLFWPLVYHLEPERWDELARSEPIHPEILSALDALARHATTALDVGAGSGRLTEHLVACSDEVIAVEPSAGLRRILTTRLPSARAVDAWAEALPIEDGWSQLTAACGALGPDPKVLAELRRVTARDGSIALISPEQPEWFEANGWQRITAPAIAPPPHDAWLDEFFGSLDPPHDLVVIRVG